MTRKAAGAPPGESPPMPPGESPGVEYLQPGEEGQGLSTLLFPDHSPLLRVRISRRDDQSQSWISHGHQLNGDFTRETVAELYGGGRYLCQVIDDNNKILRGARFELPGSYRPPQATGQGTPASTRQQPDADSERGPRREATPTELIERIMTSRFLETISSAGRVVEPSPWAPVLASFAAAFATTLPDLIKSLSAGNRRTDPALAAELASLRTLLEQQSRNVGGVASPNSLDSVKQFLELRELFREEGDSGKGGSGVIERIAEIAAAMLQRSQSEPPRGAEPLPAVGVAIIPSGSDQPVHEQFLLAHARDLQQAAAFNMEPVGVAAVVMAKLPQAQHGILAALASRPDAAAEILRVVPALNPYAGWVSEVVEEFRARLVVAVESEPDGD